MQTMAQAVRDAAGWFITAQGEINSEAYQAALRPAGWCLVKGAGTTYSGKYYVTRVTHQLTGDGMYVQKFEARRNARDLDGSEEFGGVARVWRSGSVMAMSTLSDDLLERLVTRVENRYYGKFRGRSPTTATR